MTILHKLVAVVNAGSSSLKCTFYQNETPLYKVNIDRLGVSTGNAFISAKSGVTNREYHSGDAPYIKTHQDALEWVLGFIESKGNQIIAVGHRVVHGAELFTKPTLITPVVIEDLESLIPLAPLHQPHNVGLIKLFIEKYPNIPHVACFDTAFHSNQSATTRMFAIPREYSNRGIKKYGFHGTSYEYIMSCLMQDKAYCHSDKVVIAHLGSGASLCAVHNGVSIATTMSFTALDGLTMSTRCGSIDPGVIFHLIEHEGLSVQDVSDMLYKQSGLLGISGISSDIRDLHHSSEEYAQEAVQYFCDKVVQDIGALAAKMEGIDWLIFTAGIGENDVYVRGEISSRVNWMNADMIIRVIPTNEELMIANHTLRILEERK